MVLTDIEPREETAPAPDRDWWRGCVIYQIYPRSFQDSNADGVGDLAGIIQRLPYVAALGVDAIWISPFMRSPMADFGYDVSSYRDVDPLFGTLGDFDALIRRAHDLGLRVIIDLVLSHTSDQNSWFKESRSSRDNPKADWYVWADAKPDGTAPNNWLSIFGGPAWEWDSERLQYYLHNFLPSQPDLNFHNPEVQDALLDVARYWLDHGVDGFRFDTINFFFHDKQLRDNPVLPEAERNYSTAPSVNPYNWQSHRYDKSQPENLEFLRRMRAVMDEYPAVAAVGEVGDAENGLRVVGEYTSGGDKVHMCYAFDFLSGSEAPTGTLYAEVLRDFDAAAAEGWACWAFSNHDVERHFTRWRLTPDQARIHAAVLMSMKGSVCLYQGEELGLTEAYVPFEDLRDPYGIRFWPKFRGRDGCRTPMPWASDNLHAGFSEVKPWLPIAVDHLTHAVAIQEHQEESILAFYRKMLAFRRSQPAFAKGSFRVIDASDRHLAFEREHDGRVLLCVFNLGDAGLTLRLPEGEWRTVEGAPWPVESEGNALTLAPHHALYAERRT